MGGVQQHADRLAGQPVQPYSRRENPSDTIYYDYQGMGWLEAITDLGLAYNVTGDEKYARKVIEVLRAANATAAAGNLEPIETDSGYPTRAAALGVALGFDWVYARLTPADRAATVSTLNKWFDATRTSAYERDGPATSNYYGGHLLGLGAAGYATLGDNPRAPEIVEYTRRSFDTIVRPAFATGVMAGGYPLEGYVYGANHNLRLIEYLVLVGTATGTKPAGLQEYAAKLGTNLLHALKPNRWQVPDEADYPGDNTGLLTVDLPVLLADVLAGTALGAQLHYLAANVGAPPGELSLPRSGAHVVVYDDPKQPRTDYRGTEPLTYHSAGDEHLFMRSSWADDAVWASICGGLTQQSGHQARVAGHFAVQRGNDYLLVYAGQLKGKTGLTGRPEQFQTTSAFANTLFIDDGGDYLYADERYAGGQGLFAETKPFPFAQRPDYTWAKLDLAAIYDRKVDEQEPAHRSVRTFVRNFVYLAPGTFVTFDRVRLRKPTYTTELRFQLSPQGVPKVTGNLATSEVGASALHVRSLLPRAAAIRVGWNTVGKRADEPADCHRLAKAERGAGRPHRGVGAGSPHADPRRRGGDRCWWNDGGRARSGRPSARGAGRARPGGPVRRGALRACGGPRPLPNRRWRRLPSSPLRPRTQACVCRAGHRRRWSHHARGRHRHPGRWAGNRRFLERRRNPRLRGAWHDDPSAAMNRDFPRRFLHLGQTVRRLSW